ncbi:MAG: FAD-dependent oxidoreductase [Planctomycetes bacterium]|nr:FAD-dependent oxidoreductase [Planctomycetota bacterium]
MKGDSDKVIVIGGGVIGAFCAYFLRRAGRDVTIVDAGKFGMGCSHANCGFVSPSHVLPLAGPGAIRSALWAMLQPSGPLSIKPRFDPALWGWLFLFARRCNMHDMIEAGHAIQALLQSSRTLYQQIIAEEQFDCEWETRGMLFVLATEKGMHHYAETDKLLAETFQMPARRIDGVALIEFEPALKPGLAGAYLYEGDAHLRPDRLMASLKTLLLKRGVTIREGCKVHGLDKHEHRAHRVVTSEGEFTAQSFIFATGAWTPLLAEHIGCRVPIQPGKGYSITMPRPTLCPKYPLIFEEHRVAVTPWRSGYRLGSTMQFAGYDATLSRKRLAILTEAAKLYLREPVAEPIQEEWFGWRPMTYDSKPILDRSPELENVWIAAGHNMLGLSMAPATGKLMAEMIGSQAPHLDPYPYRGSRF